MAYGDTLRKSILCEHTLNVAQHDHSKQNDTIRGARKAVQSKHTVTDFSRCRRRTLTNALKLRFMSKLLPNDLSE